MHGLSYGPSRAPARDILLSDVFGAAPHDYGPDPAWISSGFHDACGQCVASIDAAVLDIMLDGVARRMGAIRLVAVHPDWRGKGLFRQLMTQALEWCDARSSGSTLLYAEKPDLYRRFCFESVAQHAFVGPPPRHDGRVLSRAIARENDALLIRRCLEARCAVSERCAVIGAPALFLEALAKDEDIQLAYLSDLETLIAYEIEGSTLVLVDVVAPTMPSLESILRSLGRSFDRVRTLFSPDKLDWSGHPEPDDTGLMLRGPVSAAMAKPFMLPPTTEF